MLAFSKSLSCALGDFCYNSKKDSAVAKNDPYDDGYRAGRNNAARTSGGREYTQGYFRGKQEYDYWNDHELYPDLDAGEAGKDLYGSGTGSGAQQRKSTYSPLADNSSTLGTMVGGAIAFALIGWGFAGSILIILWVLGASGSFLFRLVFQIALWGSIAFVAIMSLAAVVMTIVEKLKGDPKEK